MIYSKDLQRIFRALLLDEKVYKENLYDSLKKSKEFKDWFNAEKAKVQKKIDDEYKH